MKNFTLGYLFLVAVIFSAIHQSAFVPPPKGSVPVAYSQTPDVLTDAEPSAVEGTGGGFVDFIKGNLTALVLLLFAFAEGVVRLTPTEKDNSIVNFLKYLVDFLLPNRRRDNPGSTF